MLIKCEECGTEYRGNKGGKYCSTKCYQRNSLSQYQKMKITIDLLKEENRKLKFMLDNGLGYEDMEKQDV